MKYKETNKQKYYMRNVYINQIMKPEIQNNLNYAYFENPGDIPNFTENPNIQLNPNHIYFNNRSLNSFSQNFFPNQTRVNKRKKATISQEKFKNGKYNQNHFMEFNDDDFFMNNASRKNYEDNFNDRSLSENKLCNFFQTHSFFNIKEKNNENISNLKVKKNNKFGTIIKNENNIKNGPNPMHYFDNNKIKVFSNENISSRNTNSNSSVKSGINNKKNYNDERNKKSNFGKGKKSFYSEMPENEINQINNIVSKNHTFKTTPNNNYKYKKGSNGEKNSIKHFTNESNQIDPYKNVKSNRHPYLDKNSGGIIINYKDYMNNYNSPKRKYDEYQNMDNISTLNSPSVPSYSSIIEENSNNSKNYVWVKKNIKNNNKRNNNLNNNYLNNYYQNSNIINQENIIHQNLINFANDITNMNSHLYQTEIIFPKFMNKKNKRYEELELFEQSATLIQAHFRRYLIQKKFETFYQKYKYYYHKGLEILELILNYYFKKKINVIKEKYKFFNYLISLRKEKNTISTNRSRMKNKINTSCQSFTSFNISNSTFSPVINNGKLISKFYNNLFLHKEIGERFNIIKENNEEKEIEKNYKEKIDVINIKVNKLTRENNKLKDMNQKNIIMERKFRDISKENKKKDDIINIITNDNKTLARKLKIIQDKFNKLQIQNQEDINYNSTIDCQFNKKYSIDLFEEYRNLSLSFLIHKNHEKYYMNVLRKYLYKWKNISVTLRNIDKSNSLLKTQKLQCLINNIKKKEYNILSKYFYKFYYKSSFIKQKLESKNNNIKNKLLSIFKNKEESDKLNLKKYFYKFYYQGIFTNKEKQKKKNIITIRKVNYEKIKSFLEAVKNKRDKNNKNILRENFMKWHLYTKVLALKALINERRRKKRQKQKLKKKNENEANNKYLNNDKILHFGKSNIYILNKDKEKELLISLDDNNKKYLSSQENIIKDSKLNNVIEATNKLGAIFHKAASKNIFSKDKEIFKDEIKENNDKDKLNENIDNNNDPEEEEDSGDSFGI